MKLVHKENGTVVHAEGELKDALLSRGYAEPQVEKPKAPARKRRTTKKAESSTDTE